MRARDIPEGVDHRQHDQTKSERDSDMSDASTTDVIDHDCSSPGEDEGKGPEEFRDELFHE